MTENFITSGQLWISIAEPSLGIGRVKKFSEGVINVFFPKTEILRKYYAVNAPLERIVFHQGDRILLKDGKVFSVNGSDDRKGLLYYRDVNGNAVCETDISDNTVYETCVKRLVSGVYDDDADFDLRYRTHQAKNYIAKSPCRGIIGARINPMPHQLFISQQIGKRYAPRAILADEVGLGKTIEACLALKYLITVRNYHKILIITPEHLIIQWFTELFHRFNLTFAFVDDTYYEKKSRTEKDFRPVEKNDRCILSFNLLEKNDTIQKQVLKKNWDLIIIDEAHHVKDGTDLFGIIRKISDLKKGLILLSASPDYPGLEHYFARLNLIDPSSFFLFDRFFWELERYHEIAQIAERIADGVEMTAEQHGLLNDMIRGSKGYAHLLKDGSAVTDDAAKEGIMEFLMSKHGLGRFLFRNTRKNLGAFPKRSVYPVPLAGHGDITVKLGEELSYDMGNTAAEPVYQYKNDPRLIWLIGFLEENKDEKVLLICRTTQRVLGLKKALENDKFTGFEIFHEEMDIIERDRRAANFCNDADIRLLVSSEIGSEGRNFQFCRILFFFDFPSRSDLIEQRIGRLDRIGQKNEIRIYLPFVNGSPQEYLVRWLHSGLDAFNSSLQGCEKVFDRYLEYVKKMVFDPSSEAEKSEALDEIIVQTVNEKAEVAGMLERGRDRLVEMNSFRAAEAGMITSSIAEYDDDPYIEYYLNDFFEYIGIRQDVTSDRTYLLNADTADVELFPEIGKKDYLVTYDRNLAIEREDVDFITIDHPFIERAFQFVLGDQKGATSVLYWMSDDDEKIIAEMIFLLETHSPGRLNVERFLPQSFVRIAVDGELTDVSGEFDHESVMEELVGMKQGQYSKIKKIVDSRINRMVKAARRMAYEKNLILIDSAKLRLDMVYDTEIKRLENLMLINGSIKEEEIDFIRDEKKEITGCLDNSLLRLDAVRIIYKGTIR
jgi:ATP-dependent helicase HepA